MILFLFSFICGELNKQEFSAWSFDCFILVLFCHEVGASWRSPWQLGVLSLVHTQGKKKAKQKPITHTHTHHHHGKEKIICSQESKEAREDERTDWRIWRTILSKADLFAKLRKVCTIRNYLKSALSITATDL